MKLTELFLDRNLYRDNIQNVETKDSSFVSLNSSEAEPTPVASGGAAQDINTGNVQVEGSQLVPNSIPPATLDVSNWGWGQTCAFSSTDADTVSWGAGTFTSANGLAYSISAGNTGNMSAKTYIYLDLNVSSTIYQTTTTPATAVGVGKVLIAVAQNAAVSATFMLSEATQIVGDNVIANSINASKLAAGSVAVDVYLSVGSGNAIFKADTNGIYLGNATFASAPFSVNMDGDIIASSLRRKDFHWFTVFESCDGYNKNGTAITAESGGLVMQTTATVSTPAIVAKSIYNDPLSQFSWAKKRSLKFILITGDSVESTGITIAVGAQRYDHETDIGIGFYSLNGSLEGRVSDGSNYSFVDIGTIDHNQIYRLEFEYIPDTSVKFYVDGVLEGTITTNLPSSASTDYAGDVLNAYLINNEAANKEITIGYWDLWQEN